MDLEWIKHGSPRDGFHWQVPPESATRRAIVDAEQKLKQIWYLERALEAARSVGRIVLPDNKGWATCFLVAPKLILTNHHVFSTASDAVGAVIQFGYHELYNGDLNEPWECFLDPSTFITHQALDYTLISLSEEARVPALRLRRSPSTEIGDHIAIIQHLDGAPLQIAMRDNSLIYRDTNIIQYLTNTDYGSSGSPVFNGSWQVIALHSKWVKDPTSVGEPVRYRNQGVRIEAILKAPAVTALIPLS